MPTTSGADQAHQLANATARRSYGKLVAYLSVQTRDVAAAEDALSEAFAAALADWPKNGCPDKPEAWLLTVARRRAIDVARRVQRGDKVSQELKILSELENEEAMEIPDRRLGLMFACAHPAIDPSMRAPLILQVILGLNAATIASAFLVAPSAMGQRLVRAKNKLRQAGVPFRVPERKELPARLDAVLDAIYAAYGHGWTDPGGTDAARRELAEETLFLAGLVIELMPEEPEALGLLALMLHAEARRGARRGSTGQFVPLEQQDPKQWDSEMIRRAEALLKRASTAEQPGRFQLEAAIQSAHVHRQRSGASNWPEIVQLYDALLAFIASPVVAINRAIAIAEIQGAEAALKAMPNPDEIAGLAEYQPYWAARAHLLARTGADQESRQAYQIAIGLESDPSVRRFLQRQQS